MPVTKADQQKPLSLLSPLHWAPVHSGVIAPFSTVCWRHLGQESTVGPIVSHTAGNRLTLALATA